MRPSLRISAITFTCVAWLSCLSPGLAQQTDTEEYELNGIVVNAVTGEPVGNALVQLHGAGERAQFSGANGAFVFSKLPRGRYPVTAKKPGFFDDQELGHLVSWMNFLREVPFNERLILKLTPEAVIYGQLKNENGDPLEGISVKALRWQVEDGQRRLQSVKETTTDDEGSFRIADLKSGSYRLAFLESSNGGAVNVEYISSKKVPVQGYGTQFYPGVSDVELAAPIELRAGSQVHVAQTLRHQKLFELAGVVRGSNLQNGFAVMLLNSDGDGVQKNVRMNQKTGAFQFSGVPEGTYLLAAVAMMPGQQQSQENKPQQFAIQLVHVNSDLTGLVLTVGRGTSIEVRVYGLVAPDSAGPVPQVMVRMISKEFPQQSPEAAVSSQKGEQTAAATIDVVPPGTYTVEATPNQTSAYVAAIRCGSLDLLREQLTVAPGAALPPIEVTLRNDGAQLSVKATENGQPQVANVVIFSQEVPRRSLLIAVDPLSATTLSNLPPGKYQVVALEDAQDLEFRNPAAMEKYLEQASEVTLQPGDQANVSLELQKPQEQQQ